MIDRIAMLARGSRRPGLAPITHVRTADGTEVVTVPAFYEFADVYAIGGGGNGGGSSSTQGGGGGGGGGYVRVIGIPVTPGQTFTLSSFVGIKRADITEDSTGAICRGNPGTNGTSPGSGDGGLGQVFGALSGGTLTTRTGGAGAVGTLEVFPVPGLGGAGGQSGELLEGDNQLSSAPGGTSAGDGNPAVGFGCGGGGGATSTRPGGAGGGPACVVIFRTR
jgi:hypothetical protein